ncbi:MAG: DUF6034 family protein [Christensenellales bacterium]
MKTKWFIAIMCFFIGTCCFTGCQPTPDKQIVADKNDLEQEIKEKTVAVQTVEPNQASQVPADNVITWQDQYDDEKGIFKVVVDAQVIMPDVSVFPVQRMTLAQFSDDQLSRVVSTFFKGHTVYDGNIPLTKEEIARIIIKYKAENQSSGLKSDEEYIKRWEEAYNKAPENVEYVPVEPAWKEIKADIRRIDIMGLSAKGEKTYIHGTTSTNERCEIEYRTSGKSYYVANIENENPNGLTITKQEAEAKGLEAVEQLGFQNMQIVSENVGGLILNDPSHVSDKDQCYIFYLSRTIGGIPFTYVGRAEGGYMSDEQPYAPPVNQEKIEIHVNDGGIVYFFWESPYETSEVVSDNVQLLDFEEVKRIFFSQMKKEGQGRNEWYGMNNLVNDTLNIERAQLGMMVTIDKDKPGQFLCIPVWDFFASTDKTYRDNRTERGNEQNYSILTVNAINGSIINRNLGY